MRQHQWKPHHSDILTVTQWVSNVQSVSIKYYAAAVLAPEIKRIQDNVLICLLWCKYNPFHYFQAQDDQLSQKSAARPGQTSQQMSLESYRKPACP